MLPKNIKSKHTGSSARISIFLCLMALVSCADFVKIDPPTNQIVSSTVFSDDASATAAIRGIYSLMMADQSFTAGVMAQCSGLSSDELVDQSGSPELTQFYDNSIASNNSIVLNSYWGEAYKYINNANAILEGLQTSAGMSDSVRSELTGEAKFVRAFCHFYLVNLFGDVPYVATTDYRTNSIASRTSSDDVYSKIIDDLKQAHELLSDNYSFSNNERIQPNKSAAAALLARVSLYRKDWSNAIAYATEVIGSSQAFSLVNDLNSVFLANSNEAIWQLQPVTPDHATPETKLFLLSVAPKTVSVSDKLLSAFESGDKRKIQWLDSIATDAGVFYYPVKYKVYSSDAPTEYTMVLRLSEIFLIRAEAEANLNQLSSAIADVDMIRSRAGLSLIADTNSGISKDDLLVSIYHERQVELFTEFAHRWLDLKRTELDVATLGAFKDAYSIDDALYPIPLSEIKADPNLHQNPGY